MFIYTYVYIYINLFVFKAVNYQLTQRDFLINNLTFWFIMILNDISVYLTFQLLWESKGDIT